MTKYDIDHLVKLWSQELLTVDQAIGQILLHIKTLTEQLAQLEQNLRSRSTGSAPTLPSHG